MAELFEAKAENMQLCKYEDPVTRHKSVDAQKLARSCSEILILFF